MRLRVLIAHAFFLKNDTKQLKEKFKPYPPLAALYGASMLESRGYGVGLFDAVLSEGPGEFEAVLSREAPGVLVIYEDDFNFLTKMCLSHVREATLKMVGAAKSRGVSVIVHSSDASDNPSVYLSAGADFVVYGEGELTLAELVDHCCGDGGVLPDNIPGIFFSRNGEVRKTPARENIPRLDVLPPPAWHLVTFDRYRCAWNRKHGFFSVNMVTSRGCPYSCNWCAKPIWGRQYKAHGPGYVARQLEWLVKNVSPDHIWFADDIFGLEQGWVEAFARRVEGLEIRVPFTIQSRADLIDGNVAAALKAAGCREVWLGVESGSQAVLDKMGKGLSLSRVAGARELLAEAGIEVGFFIQLGYLGEELADIEKTRGMLIDLRPERIGVSVSYPLPGTPFFEEVKKCLAAKTHWADSNDLDTVYPATFNASFYRMVRRCLHDEFGAAGNGSTQLERDQKWQRLMEASGAYRNYGPDVRENGVNQ